MPRLCTILAWLLSVACAATAAAQNGLDIGPGGGPARAPWYSPSGLCFQPLLYASPLETTYVTADLIAFRRDWQTRQVFATLNNSTNIALSIGDLEIAYQPGLRVLAGRRLNDCFAVEGSFLGLLQWDETRTRLDNTPNSQGTTGNLFSPFSNFGVPPVVGFDFNDLASIRLNSQFNNAELNLRQRLVTQPSLMQASALYGFRYMNVRETFDYRTASLAPIGPGTAIAVETNTRNNLWGLQAGGTLEFRIEPRFWLNFELKGILSYNNASQQTDFTAGPLAGPGVTTSGSNDRGRITLGGDVSATAIWKFTPRIVGRAGYQGIFIDGLALAADNFHRNLQFMSTSPSDITRNSHLAFHGPFAGVTVTW
jgi:putative beta barrel porin BBP7